MFKTSFIAFLMLCVHIISAQEWRQEISKEGSNFFEIVKNERDRVSKLKQANQVIDTKESKQFERWAYFWNTRVMNDGTFPNPMLPYNEWGKYNQTHIANKSSQVNNWSILGPTTIPESATSFYAGMGRLNVVSFNPDNPQEIWVGSPGGGIWVSTNAGNDWTPKGDQIPNLGISDIVFDTDNPNIIYIATGDYDGGDNNSLGVLKSIDHGETWQTTGLNYEVTQIRRIAHLLINPTDTDVLFATTNRGIYKSIDAGVNWSLTSAAVSFNDIMYKSDSDTTLFATRSSISEFYISTDNGETWTESSNGLSSASRLDIAITPANPDVIVALTSYALYKSIDGGSSWTLLQVPSTLETQGGYNQTVLISPEDKDLILVGAVDGWRSKDGGQSWEKYLDGYWQQGFPFFYVHSDHHDLKFLPGSNTQVYSANDGGLFVGDITKDEVWTDLSSGLSITQYYKLAGTPQNEDLILAGAQDNDITQYNGSKWINRNYGTDGVEALWNYNNSNIAWTCSQYGYMERTNNGWRNNSSQFLVSPDDGAGFVWPLEIHPTNPEIIYGGFGTVYKSENSGDDWESLGAPLSSPTVITIAPSNDQYIYTSSGNNLYVTTDGGNNWDTVSLPRNGSVTSVAVNATNPEEVFISYGRYSDGAKVYKSTNLGVDWTNLSGTLPNIPINKIAYLTGGNETLFIGTDVGVFYRSATDDDWAILGAGLPNVIVNDFEIHYATKKLRAATYGRGIWEIDIDPTFLGIEELKSNVLTILPNPTKDIVQIQLADVKGVSEITIYNIIGGVIQNFSTEKLQLDIDMTPFGSGIYLVNIKNGTQQITKKMVVE